jgi:DNA repair exonuclease SbcCD ATPase subunit
MSEFNQFNNQNNDLDFTGMIVSFSPDEVIENLVDDPLENLKQENEELKAKIAQLETTRGLENDEYSQQLLEQLKLSNQTIKNQKKMIETLSQQLEETQAQLSNLERECTQVQENYHQQTYKLIETEKHLQELHKRLLRQQRYTLEYKTTLEECFQISTNNNILANDSLLNNGPEKETVALNKKEKNSQNIPKKEEKKPKSHWPSPAIDSETFPDNFKKERKAIELPTFVK